MVKEKQSYAVNRCQRCNRELKDQNARYGWRCAEIMGVSAHLNNSGDKAFNAYMRGIRAADKFLRDNYIDTGKIDLLKFLSAYAKQYIALSINDKKLWNAAYKDKLDALNPKYDKEGNIINASYKSPPLELYINKMEMNDSTNKNYQLHNFSDKQFDLKSHEFNRALSKKNGLTQIGVLDIEKYKDSIDTYKILTDIDNRLTSTTDIHKLKILRDMENEVKSMYNQGTPILYYQDTITDFLINNAKYMEKSKEIYEKYWDLPDVDTIKLAHFINLVKTNGNYDLKNKSEWQYPYDTYQGQRAKKTMSKFMYFEGEIWSAEMLGNLSFGYLGAAYGYDEEFLCFGAGMYQIKEHGIEALLKFNTQSYGDDPRDTFQIRMGYNMYKTGRLKRKKEE